jgi:DNA-binding MarR family transcriptional regulator
MSNIDAGLFLKQLLEAFRRVASTLRSEMEPGVEWQQIAVLWSLHGGGLGTAELARMHRVSPPTMSRTLSKLIQRGWVTRQVSAVDRRAVTFQLTEAGWQVLQDVRKRSEAKLANILGTLTEEQIRDLQRGLAVLWEAFGGEHRNDKGYRCKQFDS